MRDPAQPVPTRRRAGNISARKRSGGCGRKHSHFLQSRSFAHCSDRQWAWAFRLSGRVTVPARDHWPAGSFTAPTRPIPRTSRTSRSTSGTARWSRRPRTGEKVQVVAADTTVDFAGAVRVDPHRGTGYRGETTEELSTSW